MNDQRLVSGSPGTYAGTNELPFRLGLTTLAAVAYFLGVRGAYDIVGTTWKTYFLQSTSPWVWWLLSGAYFFATVILVLKAFFIAARHYAGYKKTKTRTFLSVHGSTFISIIMICEAATNEVAVKNALGSVGMPHLDWLLLLCALGVFVGLTMLAVPED
jgi:hypothetical protein